MTYRNDIQGLRAIAILLVIAAHFSIPGLSWGFIGVDIFFVISGYLITGLIYDEYSRTGKFSYLNFYASRFRRLFPAMALMIVTTLLVGNILLSPSEHMKAATVAPFAATWTSNFYFSFTAINYFDAPLQDSLFLHTWSLSVEEQFYLLWPALLLGIANELRNTHNPEQRQRTYIILAVFVSASLIACISLSFSKPTWAYYMMPTRLWQFALGAAGYFLVSKGYLLSHQPIITRWAPVGGLALLALCGVTISQDITYPGFMALLPSLAVWCLLISGALNPSGSAALWLGNPLMRWLGNISYSLYLWHWPVWILVSQILPDNHSLHLTLSLPITFVLAVASYKFCEQPLRKNLYLKERIGVTITATAAGTLMIIAGANFLYQNSQKNSAHPELSFYQDIRDTKPWIYSYNCDKWFFSSEVLPCTIGKKNATHRAVIFGDSIAAQWLPAIQAIYNHPDWKLSIYTKSACPIIDEKIFYQRIGREYKECEIWRDKAALELKALKPDVVFMGSATTRYTEDQWTNGTKRMLDKFAKEAGQVFILRGTPVLPYNAIDCLARKKWLANYIHIEKMCEPTVSNTYNQQVFGWLKNAASHYENVKLLDLNEVICPNGVCVLEGENQVMYRDQQHLSVHFVESLVEPLLHAMTLK